MKTKFFRSASQFYNPLGKLGESGLKASVALGIMEKYCNACIIQYLRIQDTRKRQHQLLESVRQLQYNPAQELSDLNSQLFMDIHFYLIAGDKVQNMLEKIGDLLDIASVKLLFTNNKTYFKSWNDMRNHLEHQEQRLRVKFLSNFGNLANETYLFGADKFDIGENNLKKILSLYEELLKILETEYTQ